MGREGWSRGSLIVTCPEGEGLQGQTWPRESPRKGKRKRMKKSYLGIIAVALVAIAFLSTGSVAAEQKIVDCAGPADFGFVPGELAGTGPAITYDAPVFGVGVEKFNVGEEEKLALEKTLIAKSDAGIQDGFLGVPRQHIPVGTSYEIDTIAAMHVMFAPYIA